MAKRLLPPDWHVTKDNGDPATDATLAFRLAGTVTATPVWYDKDLTLPTTAGTSSISCDSTGYPAASGSDVAIWGADDVTYDVVVSATGYNGGASKTLEDIAVADASTEDETSSEMVLGNAFHNGAFDAWSGLTTFSNISGDGDGDEVADGWYFTQPAAASNDVTRQAGFAIGAGAVEQRYSLRFGRPAGSTSTNELRIWQIVAPETAYRLRGKEVTLRFSAVAGGNFSASGGGLGVRLATGTSESEDGDLIDAGGFAGHVNAIDQTQAVTTTATRFEYTVTLDSGIKEIGIQFSYTGVGTAGAADYVTIQDVELKESSASDQFATIPEVFEFVRTKLTAGGRLVAQTTFTDPGADRVFGWDDSAGVFLGFTLGTGLAFNSTAIELDAQLVDIAGLTPTDGNIIVGDGSNFVAESGATARTSVGLGTGDSPQFTGLTLTGQLSIPDGAVGSPAIRFSSDTDSGIYYTSGEFAFAHGGVVKWFFNASRLRMQVPIYASGGSVGAPGIVFDTIDTDTGWYRIGTDNWGWSAAGTKYIDWSATLAEFTLPTAARAAQVTGVGGETLAAATHRNRMLLLDGDITIDDGIFTAGDYGMLIADGTDRTVTRAAGATLYVNGVDSATATIPAHTVAGYVAETAAIIHLTGSAV